MVVRVGLQLYSVRRSLAVDPWGTLARVAEAGFTNLEAANHDALVDPGVGFGVAAAPLRAVLDDLGLSIRGCHLGPLELDVLPRALDYQAELGNHQVGCDIEFYPRGDLDHVLRRADFFNRVGELARERGMRFYYHNHFQEFLAIGDRTVYEVICESTDPSLVWLQMDTYWIYRGGQDAVAWMRRYADRVLLLHQKDFPAGAPQPLDMFDGVVGPHEEVDDELFGARKDPRCFTEIGTGVLPVQEILDVAQTLPHLQYVFLEQDHTALDEIESITRSREAFARFSGIAWG